MKKDKSTLASILGRVRYILMLVIFIIVFVLHLQGGIRLILGRLVQDLRNLDSSYDEKMRAEWGWYYDFISFIKQKTPEDANILFPPHNKQYLLIGNLGLNSYFLLPRSLHRGDKQTLQNLGSPVYVVIHKEFPSFEVEGSRIMKDSESGLIHYRPGPRGKP